MLASNPVSIDLTWNAINILLIPLVQVNGTNNRRPCSRMAFESRADFIQYSGRTLEILGKVLLYTFVSVLQAIPHSYIVANVRILEEGVR